MAPLGGSDTARVARRELGDSTLVVVGVEPTAVLVAAVGGVAVAALLMAVGDAASPGRMFLAGLACRVIGSSGSTSNKPSTSASVVSLITT